MCVVARGVIVVWCSWIGVACAFVVVRGLWVAGGAGAALGWAPRPSPGEGIYLAVRARSVEWVWVGRGEGCVVNVYAFTWRVLSFVVVCGVCCLARVGD